RCRATIGRTLLSQAMASRSGPPVSALARRPERRLLRRAHRTRSAAAVPLRPIPYPPLPRSGDVSALSHAARSMAPTVAACVGNSGRLRGRLRGGRTGLSGPGPSAVGGRRPSASVRRQAGGDPCGLLVCRPLFLLPPPPPAPPSPAWRGRGGGAIPFFP